MYLQWLRRLTLTVESMRRWIKLLGIAIISMVPLAGLLWGIFQWYDHAHRELLKPEHLTVTTLLKEVGRKQDMVALEAQVKVKNTSETTAYVLASTLNAVGIVDGESLDIGVDDYAGIVVRNVQEGPDKPKKFSRFMDVAHLDSAYSRPLLDDGYFFYPNEEWSISRIIHVPADSYDRVWLVVGITVYKEDGALPLLGKLPVVGNRVDGRDAGICVGWVFENGLLNSQIHRRPKEYEFDPMNADHKCPMVDGLEELKTANPEDRATLEKHGVATAQSEYELSLWPLLALPSPSRPPASPTPGSDMVAIHKAGIMSAIERADHAEIQAMRDLDPVPLRAVYGGEQLTGMLTRLETLKKERLYEVNRLHDQQFQSFTVSPDGRRAEARLVETWSRIVNFAGTEKCAVRVPVHQVPQSVFLERQGDSWFINSVQFHTSGPDPIGC